MASKRTTKSVRLLFTLLLCAFLLVLVVSLKAPLVPHSVGLGQGDGSNPWSSGQKLQLPSVILIGPILFVFFLLSSPLHREPLWREVEDVEGEFRLHQLRNLRLFLRPPPAI